jgi:serine/threonine-protein kinase SRK2
VQFRSLIPTGNYLCLVMEYANAGDLFKFAKQTKGLPEPAARFIFQQVILTLDYCHDPSISMFIRDVKPSNLLLVWNSSGMPLVKLTDFNLAKDTSINADVRPLLSAAAARSPSCCLQQIRVFRHWGRVPLSAAGAWHCMATGPWLLCACQNAAQRA